MTSRGRAWREIRRLSALLRWLGMTAGRAAVLRALPAYLVTGICAVILFAGQGMDARTVTDLALRSRPVAAGLCAAWLLLTLPAARTWLTHPETRLLRALPAPRWAENLALASGCVLMHTPWLALWLRGAGPAPAAHALAAALAVQISWIAGVRAGRDLLWLGAALLGAYASPRPWLGLPLALCAWRALELVRRRAPEPRAEGRHSVLSQPAWAALGSALAAATLRGHRPVFVRGVLLVFGAILIIVLREQRTPGDWRATTLLCFGPACILSAMGIAGPVLRVERQFMWLVRALRTPVWTLWSARVLMLAWGLASGAVLGLVVAWALGRSGASWLVMDTLGAGAALSLVSLGVTRTIARGAEIHPGRFLLAGLACGAAWVVLVVTAPRWAVLSSIGVALAPLWARPPLREPLG